MAENISAALAETETGTPITMQEPALTAAQRQVRDLLISQGRADETADWEAIEASIDNYTFAGKVSDQIGGADFSGDRDKAEKDVEAVVAMQEGAKVQDWKSQLAELSFDERVEKTLDSFSRRPSSHVVMSDLLKYCETERTVEETEAWLEGHRNFAKNRMSAHQYIFFMQRTGALEELEYDKEGVVLTDEMKDELRELGAPEEEIEDLTVAWHLLTTEVGKEALRRDDPKDKIQNLLAKKLSRRATYDKVITFCEQPRSMDEIFELLQGDPGLEINAQGIMQCQPSAYVSHLEEAGALYWDKGWRLTKEGEKLLAALK